MKPILPKDDHTQHESANGATDRGIVTDPLLRITRTSSVLAVLATLFLAPTDANAQQGPHTLIFYEHDNFRGASFQLTLGDRIADLKKGPPRGNGNFGDRISSIRVIGTPIAKVFEKDTFRGRSIQVTSSIPDLDIWGLDEQISSIDVLPRPAPDYPRAPRLGTDVSNPWIVDVVGEFLKMPAKVPAHGRIEVANTGVIPKPHYWPKTLPTGHVKWKKNKNHLQGINRLSGHLGLGRFIVASGSDDKTDPKTSHLLVAELQGSNGGLPWFGNLGQNDQPHSQDRFVSLITLSDRDWHPGGMQVLGKFLAIPLYGDGDASRVAFYDMSNPTKPVALKSAEIRGGVRYYAVAFTRLPDDHFLVAIRTAGDLEFWYSNTPDLARGFRPVGTVPRDKVLGGFHSYEMINFVNDSTGGLYLIGTHNTDPLSPVIRGMGKDWADLYRLDFYDGFAALPFIWKVAKKHMYCSSRRCNFLGASGVYVGPKNTLALYASWHWLRDGGTVMSVQQFTSAPPVWRTSIALKGFPPAAGRKQQITWKIVLTNHERDPMPPGFVAQTGIVLHRGIHAYSPAVLNADGPGPILTVPVGGVPGWSTREFPVRFRIDNRAIPGVQYLKAWFPPYTYAEVPIQIR